MKIELVRLISASMLTVVNPRIVAFTALTIGFPTLVQPQIASAQEFQRVTIVKGFGYNPNEGSCKMLIQSKNGTQYMIWYSDLIGAKEGSEIKATYAYEPSFNFKRLVNTDNGKEAIVYKSIKVN
jgi:hypothetical protein